MTFAGEVARLKRLTREVLLKETLREFQGNSKAVLEAIEDWRRWRHKTESELEHYAYAKEGGRCSICASVNRLPPLYKPASALL